MTRPRKKVAAAPADPVKRGRGRPPRYGEPMESRSIRMPSSAWFELERLALRQGVSQSEALRVLLGLPTA